MTFPRCFRTRQLWFGVLFKIYFPMIFYCDSFLKKLKGYLSEFAFSEILICRWFASPPFWSWQIPYGWLSLRPDHSPRKLVFLACSML